MELIIITGPPASGKSRLVDTLTKGSSVYPCAFGGGPLTLDCKEAPEFLRFEGTTELPNILRLIKAGKVYMRAPYVKTYCKPLPSILIEINHSIESVLFPEHWAETLRDAGVICTQVVVSRLALPTPTSQY